MMPDPLDLMIKRISKSIKLKSKLELKLKSKPKFKPVTIEDFVKVVPRSTSWNSINAEPMTGTIITTIKIPIVRPYTDITAFIPKEYMKNKYGTTNYRINKLAPGGKVSLTLSSHSLDTVANTEIVSALQLQSQGSAIPFAITENMKMILLNGVISKRAPLEIYTTDTCELELDIVEHKYRHFPCNLLVNTVEHADIYIKNGICNMLVPLNSRYIYGMCGHIYVMFPSNANISRVSMTAEWSICKTKFKLSNIGNTDIWEFKFNGNGDVDDSLNLSGVSRLFLFCDGHYSGKCMIYMKTYNILKYMYNGMGKNTKAFRYVALNFTI